MMFLSFISVVSSGAQVLLPHTAGPPMGSMPSPEPQVRNSFTLTFLGTRLSERKAPMRPSSAVSRVSPEPHHPCWLEHKPLCEHYITHAGPETMRCDLSKARPWKGQEPPSFVWYLTCLQDTKVPRLTEQIRALKTQD